MFNATNTTKSLVAALGCAFLVLTLGLTHAAPAAAGATDVAVQFVTAANRGDFAASPALLGPLGEVPGDLRLALPLGGGTVRPIRSDRSLAHAGERAPAGRLTRWHEPSFIELEREKTGWRIVAGGW